MSANQPMELGDYTEIISRRKTHFIVPFILVLLASLVLAFTLPPSYRSESTILIERQEIPQDLVETTVTGFVQERIEGLTKRLLTYNNLWKIAERYDLYPELRSLDNKGEVISLMRESITVEMVDIKASEAGSLRQGLATIAFTVSFSSNDAEKAQQVANELANLYLEGNRKERSEKAAEVTEFLELEAERLIREMSELEGKLAAFKQNQRDQLPELMNVNLRLFEKTENDIERAREEVRNLEDRIAALQAELSITPTHQPVVNEQGERIQTAMERLSVLTTEYLRLSTKYSEQHPDVVKVRREIQALGGQTADAGAVSQLVDQLTVLRSKLSEARQNYSENHPDVRRLKISIASVEKGLRNASITGSSTNSEFAVAPDNPRYVTLKTQLDAALGNLRIERMRIVQLQGKLKEYEKRLFQTPVVERDYQSLSRDYDNARNKYREIKDKLRTARLAERLEFGSKAERFTIVQSAFLPDLPEKPNRLGIALLGGILAFGCGIGSVSIAEYMDQTVHGLRGVTAIFHAPPLATIPYIQTKSDINSEQTRKIAVTGVVIVTLIAALAIAYVYLYPAAQMVSMQ